MRGYFERVDTGGVSGWVASGDALPYLIAVIDGKRREAFVRSAFRTGDGGRARFRMPLKLRPGNRIEILDAETGEALPGGVRFIARAGWKPRVAIVAPAKNEARYLIEWIAYHRVLGVRQFYIGDNGGDDGTSELLQALDSAGVVTRLDWRSARYFHLEFYNRLVPRLDGLADVVAPIDCDEFFRPLDGCTSLTDAVAGYFSDPSVVIVGINWASYGSSGRTAAGDGLVIERFTRRPPQDFDRNHLIKCFIRPRDFIPNNPTPHFFNYDRPGGRYVNSRGDDIEWIAPGELGFTKRVAWNTLRLDHFSIKSRDEYQAKIARGASDNPTNTGNDAFFQHHDVNDIEDSAAAELVAQTAVEIDRIKACLARPPSFWRRFDIRERVVRKRLAQSHYAGS